MTKRTLSEPDSCLRMVDRWTAEEMCQKKLKHGPSLHTKVLLKNTLKHIQESDVDFFNMGQKQVIIEPPTKLARTDDKILDDIFNEMIFSSSDLPDPEDLQIDWSEPEPESHLYDHHCPHHVPDILEEVDHYSDEDDYVAYVLSDRTNCSVKKLQSTVTRHKINLNDNNNQENNDQSINNCESYSIDCKYGNRLEDIKPDICISLISINANKMLPCS